MKNNYYSVIKKLFRVFLILKVIISVFIISFLTHVEAETVTENVNIAECENHGIWSGEEGIDIFGDICWDAFFPIRIGGIKVFDFGGIPDNVDTENIDDFNPDSFLCMCDDPTALTGKSLGLYVSFWEPVRVIELVKEPMCFPFLWGMDLPLDVNISGNYGGPASTSGDSTGTGFYNAHYYLFPLMSIIDFFIGMEWCTDWLRDLDIAYMTEVDPLWNDDPLSAVLTPDIFLFANPVAQALCPIDCVTATAGIPLNALYWCAGCWGPTMPLTGFHSWTSSAPQDSSLVMSKLLFTLARRPIPPAIEWDTSSSRARCGGVIWPVLKKSQYRFNMLVPIPETEGNIAGCAHSLGSSTLFWGEWRNIPGTETYIYLEWRKRNCCLKFLTL